MIINRIIYIAALVAAFVFSSFYEGYVPVIIRYVVILILPVSLMYLCIIYLRINIRQSVKEGIYLKNEEAEYRLEIDNKSILPYLNISIFLSDNTSVHHVDVLPFEKYVLKTGIKCCYAGECHVGVEKIILYDFLRLFRLAYNCTDMVKVRVKPQIKQADILPREYMPADLEKAADEMSGADDIAVGPVREYREGDSFRKIHWKNTARMNKLMIRQAEESHEYCPYTILIIDTSYSDLPMKEKAVTIDRILHAAICIADYYRRHKHRIDIYYLKEGQVKRHIINNDREFDNYYGQCQNISFFERDAVKMVLKDINGIYGNMRRQTIVISADKLNEEFWGE